jgi:hypothetical protein
LPSQAERRSLPSLVSLAYNRGDSLVVQETKRLAILSAAHNLLMKNFSPSTFSWGGIKGSFERYSRMLEEFPTIPELTGFWHKEDGELLVPVHKLEPEGEAYRANMAKRLALYRHIAGFYTRLMQGRPDHYREIFPPDQPQPEGLRRTPRAEEMRVFMHPALDVLRNHLPFCGLELRTAIHNHILKPELPFRVKLPD